MAISPTGDRNLWAAITRNAAKVWFGQAATAELPPIALNNEYVRTPNAAGTAYANLAKVNASDVPQLADGAVITTPGTGAGAIVTTDGTQTLTNKTFSGSISGDTARTSAAVTADATVTYADVTGLSATVVAGTYRFRCVLPSTVASGTGGIKYCFKYTTTVLTSIESTAAGFTASAVAVQHTTTTTDQTDLFTQAAVVILVEIEGTMVVSTGGTVKVQVAQNTSNASNTVALVGGTMQFTRIA